jgi:hypothetical protein
MESQKNQISDQEAKKYEELGEQWANRSLADYWQQTHPVECQIDIKSAVSYMDTAERKLYEKKEKES